MEKRTMSKQIDAQVQKRTIDSFTGRIPSSHHDLFKSARKSVTSRGAQSEVVKAV